MITGDNVLTAAHVARTLELSKKAGEEGAKRCTPLFMSLGHKIDHSFFDIEWLDYDDEMVQRTNSEQEVRELAKKYMLCCEGSVLEELVSEGLKNEGREESKGDDRDSVLG